MNTSHHTKPKLRPSLRSQRTSDRLLVTQNMVAKEDAGPSKGLAVSGQNERSLGS